MKDSLKPSPATVEASASTRDRFDPKPVVLEGERVRLEPLTVRHAEGIFSAGSDPAIWRHLPRGPFTSAEDARAFVRDAERATSEGRDVAFAIVRKPGGDVVGTTRYLDLRRADRGLEIGWTWLSPAVQRSAVNTECKYLLLKHAFETLGAVRVQLKTDARNERSQAAITRIGGVREGVLRRHMTLADGFVRDTVMFSLIDTEWPAAKARLEGWLRR